MMDLRANYIESYLSGFKKGFIKGYKKAEKERFEKLRKCLLELVGNGIIDVDTFVDGEAKLKKKYDEADEDKYNRIYNEYMKEHEDEIIAKLNKEVDDFLEQYKLR